jgi:hypothetical protein
LGAVVPLPVYLIVGATGFPFWPSALLLCTMEAQFTILIAPQLLGYTFVLSWISRIIARSLLRLNPRARAMGIALGLLMLITFTFLPIYGAGIACGGDTADLWSFVLPSGKHSGWLYSR